MPKKNYCPNCGTEMKRTGRGKTKEQKLVLESQKTSHRKMLVISAISIGVILVLAGIIAPVALKVKYNGTFDVFQFNLLSFTEPNDTFQVLSRVVDGKIYLKYIDLYNKDSQELVLRICIDFEFPEDAHFGWAFDNSAEYQLTDGVTIHFIMFMGNQWITLSV